MPSRTSSLAAAAPLNPPRARVGVYLELAKARLCALVLVSAAVGYILASGEAVAWGRFAFAMLGTALAAFGANALNQCFEVARDARMRRTAGRPLPTRRLTPRQAYAFAWSAAVLGPLVLWLTTTPLAALLAVATEVIYLAAYTPLKPRTPTNTLVGAVVGALPPMVGWAAAAGSLALGAWLLAAILFLWQIPHFLALAWMYREDYARGGFRMLPASDPTGILTTHVVLLYCLALLPSALAVVFFGLAGWWFLIGATLLGLVFVATALRLFVFRSDIAARQVFLCSVIYLPLLLGLLVLDRRPAPPVPPQPRLASAASPAPLLAQTLVSPF